MHHPKCEKECFVMSGWFSRTPGCFEMLFNAVESGESSRLQELMKKALLKATPPVAPQRDRQDWVEKRQE